MTKYYELIILINKNFNSIKNKIITTFKKLKFFILKISEFEKKLHYKINGNVNAVFVRILFKTKLIKNISFLKNSLNIEKYLIRYLLLKSKDKFIKDKNKIDYLNSNYMARYLDEFGKINSSKVNNLKLKDQRKISKYIKISRFLSIIGF